MILPMVRRCECGRRADVRYKGWWCGACAFEEHGSVIGSLHLIESHRPLLQGSRCGGDLRISGRRRTSPFLRPSSGGRPNIVGAGSVRRSEVSADARPAPAFSEVEA